MINSNNILPFNKQVSTPTTIGGVMFSDSVPDERADIKQDFLNESLYNNDIQEDMKYNDIMIKDIQIKDLVDDVRDLKAQNEVLKDQNITTRWVIGILVTVFGIITPLLFNVFASNVNSKFDSISTKIDAINQRLDYQEKLNSMQIQRDVSIEVNKKK